MAKQEGQKLKLLYLLEYLRENTDEAHGVDMAQIREVMQNRMNLQTPPDRKSIYDDLRNLNAFLDPQYEEAVLTERGKTDTHYKLIQREFELSELKLIIGRVMDLSWERGVKALKLVQNDMPKNPFTAQH